MVVKNRKNILSFEYSCNTHRFVGRIYGKNNGNIKEIVFISCFTAGPRVTRNTFLANGPSKFCFVILKKVILI